MDPTCINVQESSEVAYWTRHFGINELQLKTCVQAVGSRVSDVRKRDRTDPYRAHFREKRRNIVSTFAEHAAHVARARRSKWHRSLSVESLEGRSLLSASPSMLAAATTVAEERAMAAQILPGDEGFVPALYQRSAWPTSRRRRPGLYKGLLGNGTPRAAVVDSIWESAEHRGVQVDSFYQTFLDRAADAEGRQFYVDSMIGGMSEEAVTCQPCDLDRIPTTSSATGAICRLALQ